MTTLRALSLIAGLRALRGDGRGLFEAVSGMIEILKLRPMPRECS